MNRLVLAVLTLLICSCGLPARAADDLSGAHDFDFEFGDWTVHHRIKRASDEWYEMEGTSNTRPILNGLGNVEDNVFHRPEGDTRGVAMRAYDPATATWAIWWVDSRAPHGTLDPPVKGRFENGVGTFYSDGEINGKPVRTRFTWSRITPASARWEQAYSYDAGKTWDTNWEMTFSRAGTAAVSETGSAQIARVEQIVQHYADVEVFDGAVLVARGDEVLFSRAYGPANAELNVPNIVDTKFRIGSITKQFTAAAILLLEERGKLSVNDPVKKYYPDAPATWDRITVTHLVNHSSGIPNFTSLDGFDTFDRAAHTPEDTIRFFRDKPLDFEPGAEMRYSNSGYILLGHIIEKTGAQPYADFVAKNIFEPLGLEDTGVDSNATVLTNRAAGYVPGPNGRENAPFEDMSVPYAAGAMYSTVGDLHRWNQALYGGRLLKPETLERMVTPPTLPKPSTYAFGLGIGKRADQVVYEHGGSINGFNSYLSYFPSDRVTVVALANINGPSPNGIATKLGEVMHGKPVVLPSERVAITLPAKKLPEYAGTYELAPGRNLVIAVLDDHLSVTPGRQRTDPLFAEKKDRFFSRRFDVQIEFQRDKKGKITGLLLIRADDRREARRKPDPAG